MTGPASQPERTAGEAQVAPQPEIAFRPRDGGLDSLGPARVLALQRTAGNRAVADRLANRPRRPSLARQFPDPVSALAQARRGVVTVVASVKAFDASGHLVATASLPDAVNPEAVLDIPGGVPLRVQILLGLRQPNQPTTWSSVTWRVLPAGGGYSIEGPQTRRDASLPGLVCIDELTPSNGANWVMANARLQGPTPYGALSAEVSAEPMGVGVGVSGEVGATLPTINRETSYRVFLRPTHSAVPRQPTQDGRTPPSRGPELRMDLQ